MCVCVWCVAYVCIQVSYLIQYDNLLSFLPIQYDNILSPSSLPQVRRAAEVDLRRSADLENRRSGEMQRSIEHEMRRSAEAELRRSVDMRRSEAERRGERSEWGGRTSSPTNERSVALRRSIEDEMRRSAEAEVKTLGEDEAAFASALLALVESAAPDVRAVIREKLAQ